MKKYSSLDNYKTDINLVDFMLQEKYGFKLAKDSSPNSPKIARINSSGAKEELYVIKKNEKGHFTYWSPHDDSLKGKTIIDFVQDNHKAKNNGSFHLGLVRKLLDAYIKGDHYIAPTKSKYNLNSYEKVNDEFKQTIKNCRAYTDRDYLNNRGITNNTINNKMFSSLIKNIDFEKDGKKYINTAYLMVNQKELGAINIKNKTADKSFSGCYGDRGTSIVISKMLNKNTLDKLIINESFDDSLSHYQINESILKNENVRYIATAGSLCEGQISLIEKVIEKQQPKKFLLGFDNDISGNFFRAKLMGKLQIAKIVCDPDFLEESKAFAFAHIDCKKEKNTGFVDFIFSNNNQVEGIENINELKGFINIYNEKFKDTFQEGEPFDFKVKLADDNKAIGQIVFKNSKENWIIITDLIDEVKYEKNKFFVQELPLGKDFNDDLVNAKKVSKNLDI